MKTKDIDTLSFEAYKENKTLPVCAQTPDHYWADWYKKGYQQGFACGKQSVLEWAKLGEVYNGKSIDEYDSDCVLVKFENVSHTLD